MKRSVIGAGLVLAVSSVSLGQWSDDFNRPDGPIGPDWNVTAGSFAVQGNQGRSTASGIQSMTHATASAAYTAFPMSVDVICEGTGLQYVALQSGLGGSNNLFIKVQSQDASGMFNTFGLYQGNNGGGWGGAGSGFFTLSAPFAAARMTVTISNGGDHLQLDFDTDFNGTPDQTYACDDVNLISGLFGQQWGIGAYNTGVFDNWNVGAAAPACYPDCNGDSVLNLSDFGCFTTKFALGDPYADCNGDSVLNLSDFGCFTTKFALGCP
ncbi:MAG: hypothetical protein IT437_04915 [Phycisphaerales bacterium]|nr:hypothetical protein [Phycisphaerales bacterium]